MLFDEKKLAVESITDLLQCRVDSVEPFALMLAPVYVLMKLNEKLVSVKAPLDFFTPDELDRLKRYEVFYIPRFLKSVSRFQTAAKLVSSLMRALTNRNSLPPSPFEVSNEVIQVLSTLWGKDYRVEVFFLAVFGDELCGSLAPDQMVRAREKAVVRHDAGILLSGMTSFVLAHLGWFDLQVIQQIRRQVYTDIVDRDETWLEPRFEWEVIARDLKRILSNQNFISRETLISIDSEWAKKLKGRLDRVESIAAVRNYTSLSIGDEGGFAS